MLQTELHRLGAARVRSQALAVGMRHIADRRDFRFGHYGVVCARVRDELVTRWIDLERVHAFAHHLARGLAELVRAVANNGESLAVHVQQPHVTEPRGRRKLGTGGERSRPREIAGVDRVPQHHVEPCLRRSCAVARGEALVEHFLCVLHGAEHVLLRRNKAQRFQVRGVEEGHVRVGFDQAGHQSRPAAIHHLRALARNFRTLWRDGLDAVAFHQHLARVRRRAAAIQDIHVLEQNLRHFCSPHGRTD